MKKLILNKVILAGFAAGLGLGSVPTIAMAESNGFAYYGQIDVAHNQGQLEGDAVKMKNEHRYVTYGAALGAAFNPSLSADVFYHRGDRFDVQEYGIKLNFRKVMRGDFYGVVSAGLGQTDFVCDDNELGVLGVLVDADTGIKPLFNIGAGYRFNEKTNLEITYGRTGEVPRLGASFIYRFN